MVPGNPGDSFPPREAEFVLGDAYHQVRGDTDELSLEQVPAARLYECFVPAIGLTAEFLVDRSVATVEKVGEVVINVTEQSAITAYNGVTYLGGKGLDSGGEAIDLVTRNGWQLILKTGHLIHLSGKIVKQGGPDGSTNSAAYVWLPLFVPQNATAMAFDYTVSGDPRDDQVAFGINGTNVFSLSGKFVPESEPSASRLIDVSTYAGATNEFFFGITGGTSTNCTFTVQNIRFFTLQRPELMVELAGGDIVLSWPSTANGYFVESASRVAATNWAIVPQPPTLFAGRFSLTNPVVGEAQFFRLRRP